MKLKLLPEQISSYSELITGNYAFVDKTRFIELIEKKGLKVPLFLRPRRFGKTLFSNILADYYDISTAHIFNELFADTYIGKNPTPNRNSCYILRLDFSGIDSRNLEANFFIKVKKYLQNFCIHYRDLNLGIDQVTDSASSLITQFFSSFRAARRNPNDRLFIIIDEYDNFANEVLTTDINHFRNITSSDGFLKNFYATLKAESASRDTAIWKFFITGVSSIMINSVTSGFNSKNISFDSDFNEMAGFTENELRDLISQTMEMTAYDQIFTEDDLIAKMKLYFDGYSFCRKGGSHLFNSSMCINYLSRVMDEKELTNDFSDANVSLDVDKFSRLMNLIREEDRIKIIRSIAQTGDNCNSGYLPGAVVENLNINRERDYTFSEGISMLFYLGYLTFYCDEENEDPVFKVPNLSYRKMFMEYYISQFFNEGTLTGDYRRLGSFEKSGDMDSFVKYLDEIITGILPDNRNDVNERVIVSLAGEVILTNLRHCSPYVEYEIRIDGRRTKERADLVVFNEYRNRPSFLIEFKFLRETAEHKDATREKNIEEQKREAREQIRKYMNDDRLKITPNLQKYIIIYAYDRLIWEKYEQF